MRYETITSPSNPLVKRICELKKSKRCRESEGLTLVEGRNLLQDLLKVQSPSMLFVTEEHLQENVASERLILVSKDVMKKISTVETPEGILGVFPIQKSFLKEIESPLLILDGLQDPGNVGTLLRTAAAFGVKHCVAIDPCADIWHPKVMRSAKGAHYLFSSLVTTTWKDLIPVLRHQKISLLVATLHAHPIETVAVPKNWALVIGSEAKGPTIPQEVDRYPFTIPIESAIDSLNAAQAGAIALYYCKAALQRGCAYVG